MIFYNKKNPVSLEIDDAFLTAESIFGCCGILEISGIEFLEGDYYDVEEGDVVFSTRSQAIKASIAPIVNKFGRYPIVIMSDKVGGDAHTVMKALDPPGYKKKLIYSKTKNPSSGNKLVMCTWIKQAQG